jgi:hypothetical protein
VQAAQLCLRQALRLAPNMAEVHAKVAQLQAQLKERGHQPEDFPADLSEPWVASGCPDPGEGSLFLGQPGRA